MRAWVPLLALSLSGCVFYLGDEPGDDDWADGPGDGWEPEPDAGPAPDAALPYCAWPSAGRATICGRINDVATGGQPESFTYDVQFYDALDYAANPIGAIPLDGSSYLDAYGNFVGFELEVPPTNLIAVVVDDAASNPLPRYRATVIGVPVYSGGLVADQWAYLLRSDTDRQWSEEIGLSQPPTIVDQGAILKCFSAWGSPVAGVTATEAGAADPEDDVYFADGPYTRQQLNPTLTVTGANGCVLDRASPMVNHSGTNGGLGTCFPDKLAAAIPGVLFVSTHDSTCAE